GGGAGALLVGGAGFADVRAVPDHLGDQVAVAQQHGGVGAAGIAGVDVVLEAGLQERRLPRVRHVTDRADPFAQHGALGGLPAGPLQIEPAGRHLGGTARPVGPLQVDAHGQPVGHLGALLPAPLALALAARLRFGGAAQDLLGLGAGDQAARVGRGRVAARLALVERRPSVPAADAEQHGGGEQYG